MPKGDGTGPYGDGPQNESGRCEGRGRQHARKPLGEHKRTHAHDDGTRRPGGRRRCRDRHREDCDHGHHHHYE